MGGREAKADFIGAGGGIGLDNSIAQAACPAVVGVDHSKDAARGSRREGYFGDDRNRIGFREREGRRSPRSMAGPEEGMPGAGIRRISDRARELAGGLKSIIQASGLGYWDGGPNAELTACPTQEAQGNADAE